MTDPQVIVTRRTFVWFSALLGLALAGVIVLGIMAIVDIGDRISGNKSSIHRLDALTKRLDSVEAPTPAQDRERLRRSIIRCLKDPSCRELFPGLALQSGRKRSKGETAADRAGTPRPLFRATTPAARTRDRTPSRPARPSRPNRPSRPSPGAGGAPAPEPGSSTPPANPSPPIASLSVPAPVTLCTDLVELNC